MACLFPRDVLHSPDSSCACQSEMDECRLWCECWGWAGISFEYYGSLQHPHTWEPFWFGEEMRRSCQPKSWFDICILHTHVLNFKFSLYHQHPDTIWQTVNKSFCNEKYLPMIFKQAVSPRKTLLRTDFFLTYVLIIVCKKKQMLKHHVIYQSHFWVFIQKN